MPIDLRISPGCARRVYGFFCERASNSNKYELRAQRGLKHLGEVVGDLARGFVLPHQRKGCERDKIAKAPSQLLLLRMRVVYRTLSDHGSIKRQCFRLRQAARRQGTR